MTCDAENFYLVNTMQGFENGKLVFEKTWRKEISRRLV
jgi:hypothetical protein